MYTCQTCNNIISSNRDIYKAYDLCFCSHICRHNYFINYEKYINEKYNYIPINNITTIDNNIHKSPSNITNITTNCSNNNLENNEITITFNSKNEIKYTSYNRFIQYIIQLNIITCNIKINCVNIKNGLMYCINKYII